MIKGITESGFEFEVDDRCLSDWKFMKAIAKSDSKDQVEQLQGAVTMVNMLLGEEGEEKLIEFVAKDNDGYAPSDKVSAIVKEIFTEVKKINEEAKKSSPSPASSNTTEMT